MSPPPRAEGRQLRRQLRGGQLLGLRRQLQLRRPPVCGRLVEAEERPLGGPRSPGGRVVVAAGTSLRFESWYHLAVHI